MHSTIWNTERKVVAMLTLLGMIGLFLLVLLLAVFLLLGMFFSSDFGYAFTDVFNYATTTGLGNVAEVVTILAILGIAFAVQATIWLFIADRMIDTSIPDIVQQLIIMIVLLPIPAFFFTCWGTIYRWAGVLCILAYIGPVLLNGGSFIYSDIKYPKSNGATHKDLGD